MYYIYLLLKIADMEEKKLTKKEKLNMINRLNKMKDLVYKKNKIQDSENNRKLLKHINDLIEEL